MWDAPDFVVNTKMKEGARVVTFASGMTARELIASLQVFAEGTGRSRVVWTADLRPNEVAGHIQAMIEQGMGVMKRTLER